MRRLATAPGAIAILAEHESTLAGFVILDRGYVSTLDIHPEYRRRGLAHRLMQSAEAASATTSLLLHVSTENAPAIAFYESCGFIRKTIIKNFYAPNLDAIEYFKPLAPIIPASQLTNS